MQTNYQAIAEENIRRFGTDIDDYGPRLLADRYSDRTHFVYELLQNAEDAIGWRLGIEKGFKRDVAFRLTPDALFFQHSGLPFAEEHVRGICNIGKGTKRQDLTAIGKHGIGFKSVYAYSQHPEVHSGDEHFVIDSFVRPRATAPMPTAQGETLFVLRFDHPDIPPKTAHEKILERLRALGLKTLLFLRHVSSIRWEAGGESGEYLREPHQLDNGIEHVTLMGQESKDLEPVEERWLVTRKEVFDDGKAAGFVEVAFKVETNVNDPTQTERVMRVSDSPLVVFFPTEKETQFGFLIQGPYQTTPSRDNVPKDVPWNQYLISCTAELVTESLEKLQRSGYLTANALDAFVVDPEKFEGQSQAAMFRPIAQSIITALKLKPLIPRYKSGCVSAACAKLARAANVRSLVNSEQLTTICNSPERLRWVIGDITRERMPQLHTFLTNTLRVEEIDAESVVRRMSEPFLKGQTDEWIQDLYEFLHDQPAVQRQHWFASKPFVRLSTNSHVTAVDGSKVPLAYLPSKRRTGFPTVKKSVCGTEAAIKFLHQIGLKEPDPVDDVIVNVLSRRYTEVTKEYPVEFDDDVERIIEAYQTDSQSRRADLLERLKGACWIPCRNAEDGRAVLGTAESNTYLPTQKLAANFAGNGDVWFVDRSRPVMQGKACQTLLQACGVAEFLQRCECECDLSGQELDDLRQKAGLQRSSGHKLTDYTIEGLEAILQQIAAEENTWQERSRMLWDCLHDAIRNFREGFLFGEYQWSFNRDSRTVRFPAQFVRMLRQSAWLPGKDGKPWKSSQICFSDLPPEFQTGANETLVSLLEFKPDEIRLLAEKSGIDTAILDLIREHGLTVEALRNHLGITGVDESENPEEGKEAEEAEDEKTDTNTEDTTEVGDGESVSEGNDEEGEQEGGDEGSTLSGGQQGQNQGRRSGSPRNEGSGRATGGGPGRSSSDGIQKDGRRRGQESEQREGEKGARGHTADDREGIIDRLKRQLEEATSTGVIPASETNDDELGSTRTFQSDARFREAVVDYEGKRGRTAIPKSETEEGHDIDSFVREKGSLGRKLLRRIEVKGKGVPWTGNQIVEMSNRQYSDASKGEVESGLTLAEGFDYWLYVVEDDGSGKLTVLPIRNPAKRAAHYEFRAGTWRHLAEIEAEKSSAVTS